MRHMALPKDGTLSYDKQFTDRRQVDNNSVKEEEIIGSYRLIFDKQASYRTETVV